MRFLAPVDWVTPESQVQGVVELIDRLIESDLQDIVTHLL